MSLSAIPENLLYNLLPSAVVELDQRGLLQAVVGGFQDRLEDLRSAVKRYEVFLDPLQTTPEGTVNSLLVSLTGDQGNVIQRSVEIDDTTPDASDTAGLLLWAAERLGIDDEAVISATYASDPLRAIDTNLLEYLAATIGAVIYKTDVTANSLERQRQLVASYFPRLRAKGTVPSYTILGKLLGFDDVLMTPLWGRASPRLPNDVGNPVNDPDFQASVQYEPTVNTSVFYDPNKLDDGPFFQWRSGALVTSPSDDPSFVTSVNGLNPFIIVKASGTVTDPLPGTYTLLGGGPHTKAQAAMGSSGLVLQAIAEGASFNNLKVEVTATGSNQRELAIVDRLSSVKYRTSYYNLGLFVDIETATETAVRRNKDLQASPISSAGTAVSPFYPWSSTGTQASVNALQLDSEAVVNLGMQASAQFESVRAATRYPRRVGVGYTSADQAKYAAFQSRTDIFTSITAGTYAGTVAHPPLPYSTSIAFQADFTETISRPSTLSDRLTATLLHVPERGSIVILSGLTVIGGDDGNGHIVATGPGLTGGTVDYLRQTVQVTVSTDDLSLTLRYLALVPMAAEEDGAVINFSGSGITGSYNVSSGSFSFTEVDGGIPNGRVIAALWTPSSSEPLVLQDEPSGTLKSVDRVGYQLYPEEVPDFVLQSSGTGAVSYQLHDEYAWRRPLTAGGELVDVDLYQPPVPDLVTHLVEDVMVVTNHEGVEQDIIGFDSFSSGTLPIRVAYVDRDITPETYKAGQPAVAVDSSGTLYPVGLVQGVLVADPVSFFHPSHRDDLVGWLPFNEHPDDDLQVIDHSSVASVQSLQELLPSDRVWDESRGWHLRLRPGVRVLSGKDRGCTSQASLSFFLQPYGQGSREESSTILVFGPISLNLSPSGQLLTAYVLNEDHVRVKAAELDLGTDFNYVTVRASGNIFLFGVNGVESTAMQAGSYQDFTDAVLLVQCQDATFGIHDLRIWGVLKSLTDLERVRSYPLTPTVVNYSSSYFLTAGQRERWGLLVLDSGHVVPAAADGLRAELQQYVQRYGDDGRYSGDLRFKEVGLGNAQLPPTPWKVGNRFFPVQASGQVVVASSLGEFPGSNAAWDAYSSTGTLFGGTLISPGVMVSSNPVHERLWVKGDDLRMYEVTAEDDGHPYLAATPFYQDRVTAEYETTGSLQHMHQPTGAETQVTTSGSLMSVRLDASGTYQVYQSSRTLPVNRPPVYLYNMTQTVVSQAGTENWDGRTEFGLALGVPARDRPGVISFLNEGTLIPGPHRLDIESSVIGNPGVNFPGFDVEVTVGPDTVPVKLAEGVTIQDPYSNDTVEFDVTASAGGRWALEFNWLSDLDIPAQGIFRDLAIHSYTLRRVAPRLYKVASAAGSLQAVDVVVHSSGTLPPGGFLATLSSSGTVSSWLHESEDASRPEGDSFQSVVPLSDMLTATTDTRREDVLLLSYTGTLATPDLAAPVVPAVTLVATIAEAVETLWVWSGAITSTSANVRARVSRAGYVRLMVSASPNFSQPKFSEPVYASNAVVSTIAGSTNNVVSLDITGLEPNTVYYYVVGGLDQPDFTKIGTFRTWPVGQASFSFAMSSSAVTGSDHAVFDTIRGHAPLFFLHTGNMHQSAISVSTGSLYQAAFESTLGAAKQAALYRSTPLVYMWDELDYGPTHSYKASPGRESAQATYRQYVPHYQLVASGTLPGTPLVTTGIAAEMASGPIYHSFTVGRVYFIVTDLRSAKDGLGDVDVTGKSMMGAVQKAWFKRQLLDASVEYPMIVWVSSVPWLWDGTTINDDGWGQYTAERAEIANFIQDNGINGVVVIGGNFHGLAADDGLESGYADGTLVGMQVLHAGALDGPGSVKGGAYSTGPAKQGTGQFAIVTVTDLGSTMTVLYSGRDWNNVELLRFEFNLPGDSFTFWRSDDLELVSVVSPLRWTDEDLVVITENGQEIRLDNVF